MWLADKATLTEIEKMTLDDVDLANLALDAWTAAEREAKEQERRAAKAKRGRR